MAKVITYTVFGLLLTLFVFFKLKIQPLTKNHGKLLLIILAVLAVHHLLPVLENHFLDALYRTVIVAIIGIVAVYKFNISPDANRITDKMLKRKK